MQTIHEEASSAANADASQQEEKLPKGPRLLEVRREVFGQILLTLEVVQDHLPDAYLATINQL